MRNKHIFTGLGALAFLLLCSMDADACAVCFGERGTPLANALDKMVYVMFACMAAMFTAIVAFFYTLHKRAKKAGQENEN